MQVEQLALVLAAAVAAGWVDAVVGGGGLLLLPALLAAGLPPVPALAANKCAAICGTASAALAYGRRIRLDPALAVCGGLLAVPCAALGALAASAVPAGALRPAILAVLSAVGVFVAVRPAFGRGARPRRPARARPAAALLGGAGIACYDGLFGPGTGTFLIVVFTGVLGMDLVRASAHAKIVNTGSNLGALLLFAAAGQVPWALGLAMAAGNVAGAQLGARMALRRGTGFVRAVLLGVVAVLVARLACDQFAA